VDGERQVYRRAVNGPHIDFAGPGVQLWTAASVSGGRFRSGTSYAAPFVSAALAVARAREPETPSAQLVSALAAQAADLGAPGRDEVFGWGLVQTDGICH
jgi:subtilisin family serine protease